MMKFTDIERDILRYIIAYYTDPRDPVKLLIPSIGVLEHYYRDKYIPLEINAAVLELVSRRILNLYSFHGYLELTETFKTSNDYTIFKEQKI